MNRILYRQILPMMEELSEHSDQQTEKSEPVHVSKETREFAKRFQPPAEVKATERVTEKPEKPEAATNKADDFLGNENTQPAKEKGRPGSNVPQIIESKRKAEAERDEAKKKLQEFEATKIPALTSKIDELQKKIDTGTLDPAKERAFESKIAELERQRTETEQKLYSDIERIRKRLEVYDVTENPVYKEKYLKPLANAIENLRDFTSNNRQVAVAVQQATMLQKNALEATSIEDKRDIEQKRDEIISAVMDGMNAVTARRFEAAFYEYSKAAENQALSLAEFEKTNEETKAEWTRQQEQTVQSIKKDWEGKFFAAGEEYKDFDSIPDDVSEKIKELGIEIDPKKEREAGLKAIHGELNQQETVRLIQRGSRFAIAEATIKGLRAIVSEQSEQLSKLRGASPPKGERSSGQPPKRTEAAVNEAGEDRAAFNRRFAPPAGITG